jgi:alkylation response protein AidB-like acyl-CoA dehydrogenase
VAASELDEPARESWQAANRGFIARTYPIELTRSGLEQPRALDRQRWSDACAMGWIAGPIAVERGGLGVALEFLVDLAEELGRGLVGDPYTGCVLSAAVIATDPALRDDLILPSLLDGSSCCAWCVAEDDRVWTPERVAMVAHPDRGGLRLSGIKQYVVDADVADAFVVSARVDGRLRNLLVPARTAGVSVSTARGFDLTRSISTVRFDDVRLPVADRWDARAAEHAVRFGLGLGTLVVAADAIGAAQRLMEMTVEYVLAREVFGRPLASYQAVKHKCADMLCGIEGSQVAALAAARSLAFAGEPGGHAMDAATRALHVLGSFAGEACSQIAGEALQLHGGIGFTWEHDLHLYLRRIKVDEALFGPIAWHRDELGRETIRRVHAARAE